MQRAKLIILCIIGLFIVGGIYIHQNIDSLKSWARSFSQGSWYIEVQQDTLYTVGVYGIKQYCIEGDGKLRLLNENKQACEADKTCRGCAIGADYLYVTVRHKGPGMSGFENPETVLGEILVVEKATLNVVNRIESKRRKQIECQLIGSRLVVEGINGFEIYDVADPVNPIPVFSTEGDNIEFQGGCIFEAHNRIFACFPHWEYGLSVWDITHNDSVLCVTKLPRDSISLSDGSHLAKATQQFHAIADYPYVYTTLGPANSHTGLQAGVRNKGILVYDVSHIDSIRVSAAYIPESDWYTRPTGDMQPTYLAKHGDTLYCNFSDKGVAAFDVSEPMSPRYKETLRISVRANPLSYVLQCKIQSICITPQGWLFAGDYNTPHIYRQQLGKP